MGARERGLRFGSCAPTQSPFYQYESETYCSNLPHAGPAAYISAPNSSRFTDAFRLQPAANISTVLPPYIVTQLLYGLSAML